jgi:inorganic triphosphatase YgiF
MAREIELKFSGPVSALERLRRSAWLKSLASGRAKTSALKTTYFDTAAQDLAARGVSLRIRKSGARHVQTVKSMNGKTAPKWDRAEQDASVDGLRPNPDVIENLYMRRTLADWLDKGELNPVFETEFKRTAIPLQLDGGVQVEAAFDFGAIRALGSRAGVSQNLAELELELKSGDPMALFALARQVAREAPLRFALDTKADRGYALALGASGDAAVRARPLNVSADMASSDAFALMLGEGLKQIVSNESAILRARNVEGVHQMRVAIRRLRSVIAAFGKAYEHGEIVRLKAELSWLAGQLGAARDWDVFQARILKPVVEAFPNDGGLYALAAAARSARRAAWDAAAKWLESERYRLLMIDLAAAISGRVWEDKARRTEEGEEDPYGKPLLKTARKCLNKRLDKATALGDRIAELSVPERHELRIRLKRLRYASDFLSGCFPAKPARRYMGHLSKLQDVFGELNDVAVAETLIAGLVDADAPDGSGDAADLARAGGMVLGWHMALSVRLWDVGQKRWRRFVRAKPFWR